MKEPAHQSAAVRSFAQLWQVISPYLPRKEQFLTLLSLLTIAFIFGSSESFAQATFDNLGGQKVGSQLCSLGNSIENSIIGKGICVAVIGYGVLKWLPTRKDGIPEMTGGLIGFIVVTKVKTIMSLFGVSC